MKKVLQRRAGEKGPPTEEEGWAAQEVVSTQRGNRFYNGGSPRTLWCF
jgi:hypothetical protein